MKLHALLLILAATTAHAVDYTYDALGRLRAESFSNNAHILHSYDTAGNRTERRVIPPSATPNADLVTTLTLTPDPAAQGLPVTATITVQNLGPDPAPNVQVTSSLPVAFSPNSATATQGSASLSGQNLTATLGTIPSGETATITVQGIADGTANFITEATATSPADSTPGNNTGSDNTTPDASADLVLLRLQSGPQPVLTIGTVLLSFTARNEGPATATNAEATVTLPTQLAFAGVSGGTGSSAAGQVVTITLGNLAPGTETSVFVFATPTTTGDFTTTFSLDAAEADPDATNHSGDLVTTVLAPTLTVTNANDSGTGSLRQAILDANAAPDADVIGFAIPGGVVPTIAPATPLPDITAPVMIDGWSQPEFGVEINGAGQGANTNVLVIRSDDVTVRSLTINRSPRDGIFISAIDSASIIEDVQIYSCSVGVDPFGTLDLGNTGDGIEIVFADRVTIGGPEFWQGCVISGNGGDGIFAQSGSGHVIQGNRIGCNLAGTAAIENGSEGITFNAFNSLIGGTGFGEGNQISGNREEGVQLGGVNIKVFGNLIGTDASGTTSLPNGTSPLADRLAGIVAGGSNCQIGGPDPGQRNIISGNRVENVRMQNRCLVIGNYIGLDITGTQAVGGLDPNAVGVRFNFSSATSPCVLGSPLPGHGNVISGNPSHGVFLKALSVSGSHIVGNFIGTSPDGKTAIPNGSNGILSNSREVAGNTIGGSLPGAGNLIAGNAGNGIRLFRSGSSAARHHTVQGNRIGVNVDGAPLGNGNHGIQLDSAQDNVIGGTIPGAANLIAHNTADGVSILTTNVSAPAFNNRISGNSIRDNGGLGIDLNDDGITANDAMDADAGPNNLQNFPVVTLAEATGGSLIGAFNSTPNTAFHVEFFSNAAADPSGNGEGAVFLGQADLTTDANGDADYALASGVPLTTGHFVTTTVTDPDGNTSEFGPVILVAPAFTFVDSDGDGMSDDFELEHFGSGTGGDPDEDDDGDGSSNLYEFVTGTNPKNPDSVFSVALLQGEGRFTVRVKTEVGRLYRLQSSTQIAGFAPLGTEVAGTGGFLDFIDTDITGTRKQYRVSIRFAE